MDELKQLIAPLELESFLDDYFEQKPMVARGSATSYLDVLSNADFEQLLASASSSDGSVSLVRGRAATPDASFLNEERFLHLPRLYEAFAGGTTLLLTRLQKRWPPIARLCRAIEGDLLGAGLPLARQIGANGYLTPASSQGFPPHYDDHCVLVLQLSGMKRWLIYGPIEPLPVSRCEVSPAAEEIGPPLHDVVIAPGDVLYVPRGFYHEASTAEVCSLHLTLSIHVYTWRDLLLPIIERTAALRSVLPRHTLSGGADTGKELRKRLRGVSNATPVGTARRALQDRLWNRIDPLPDSGLHDREPVAGGTLLVKRSDAICSVTSDATGAALHFPGGGLRGPACMEPVFLAIASVEEITADALPDLGGAYDRLDLVRQLVSAGVLRISETTR